ncbi:MAG: hypothetical protein H7X89_14450 [Rhizobiales bacterium]|nr:hypothetical protein [Hyphomicrobiales bacterium]
MNPAFKNLVWDVTVRPPWRATDCENCIEFTQPEGTGALHVSNARKKAGTVDDGELVAKIKNECPEGTDIEQVRCGDFAGYVAEYTDWHADAFWKTWFVACRQDLLFITYTCKRGEEALEMEDVSILLRSLRWKG